MLWSLCCVGSLHVLDFSLVSPVSITDSVCGPALAPEKLEHAIQRSTVETRSSQVRDAQPGAWIASVQCEGRNQDLR